MIRYRSAPRFERDGRQLTGVVNFVERLSSPTATETEMRRLDGRMVLSLRRSKASAGTERSTAILTTQCMIEPGLWPASPKKGNIRGVSQRLSPSSVLVPGNREHRDASLNCKSLLLAGLSATIGCIFSEPRTAWLATQC
jgi:hypothetical protein